MGLFKHAAEQECKECEGPLEQVMVVGRIRKYCSAACRQASYRARVRADKKRARDALTGRGCFRLSRGEGAQRGTETA